MQHQIYQQPLGQQPLYNQAPNSEASTLPGAQIPVNNLLPGQDPGFVQSSATGISDLARPNTLVVGTTPTLAQDLPRRNLDPSTTQTVFPYGDLPYEEPGLLTEAGQLRNQIGNPCVEPMIVVEHSNIREQPLTNTNQAGYVVGQPGVVSTGESQVIRHHQVGKTGVGRITFRPIEGRFTDIKETTGKFNPYCKFKIGWKSGKSSAATGAGTNANWIGDAISLKVKNHEYAKLKVNDKGFLGKKIGTAEIPLAQVISQGLVTQWIPISKKGTNTGEVQIEMTWTPGANAVEPTL